MDYKIVETAEGDPYWKLAASHFPHVVKWKADSSDDGEYHVFLAIGSNGECLGGAVIDIGRLNFGPLADVRVGFLEEIHVEEDVRRTGVGSDLSNFALELAWKEGAQNVRTCVGYEDETAARFFLNRGFAVIPLEDPDSASPEKSYLMVATNPECVTK